MGVRCHQQKCYTRTARWTLLDCKGNTKHKFQKYKKLRYKMGKDTLPGFRAKSENIKEKKQHVKASGTMEGFISLSLLCNKPEKVKCCFGSCMLYHYYYLCFRR
jgi:hypothetical protein